MSEKIQVRAGWWRQRYGDIVRVWRNESDSLYPWQSVSETFTEHGEVCKGKELSADLIEYLGETDPTLRQPAQDDRRELIRRFAVAILAGGYNEPMTAAMIWARATRLADAEPGNGGET